MAPSSSHMMGRNSVVNTGYMSCGQLSLTELGMVRSSMNFKRLWRHYTDMVQKWCIPYRDERWPQFLLGLCLNQREDIFEATIITANAVDTIVRPLNRRHSIVEGVANDLSTAFKDEIVKKGASKGTFTSRPVINGKWGLYLSYALSQTLYWRRPLIPIK